MRKVFILHLKRFGWQEYWLDFHLKFLHNPVKLTIKKKKKSHNNEKIDR